MSDRRPQLALREWRKHLLSPLTLSALAAVAAILALVGPFRTIEALSLPERLAYWGTLVVVGYVIGYAASNALLRGSRGQVEHTLRVAIAGLVTGLLMSGFVTALNSVVFGFVTRLQDLPTFLGTVIGASVILVAVLDLFIRRLKPQAHAAQQPSAEPALLARVPVEKRGALVAVSVEDHYVRIRTNRGEHMVLMRLADAIRETAPARGAQVHRSHWASFDHVVGVTKRGDGAMGRCFR